MKALSDHAGPSLLAIATAWLLAQASLGSGAEKAYEPAYETEYELAYEPAAASCESVKAHFSDQPEIAATIGSRLQYDKNLVLCAFENHTTERRQSCCSEQSERAFEAQAWRDYNDSINQETRETRSLFTKTAAVFRDGFMDMVDRAEIAARSSLVEQNGHLTQSDHHALHRFFSDLRAALQEPPQQLLVLQPRTERQHPRSLSQRPSAEAAVASAASTLLEHMFARTFFQHHSHSFTREGGAAAAAGGSSDFSDEYAACVRHTWRSVASVTGGGVAAGVAAYASRLGRGLSAGAGLLHALHLAADMVQTAAERAPLTVDCVKDIVKMSYCGSCYGQPVQRPCGEFCTDVLGVCMGELRRLERAWDSHLSVLRMLVEFTLRQGYVQALLAAAGEEVIASGSRHMRGLYTGANAAILYDRVVSQCGPPRIHFSDEPATASGTAAAAIGSAAASRRQDAAAQELSVEVRKFLALLDTELRGFFGRLPPSICMTDRYYDMSAGRDCWDGLMTRTNGTVKRLEFLQELAPKPPPLASLEVLKQKLAAVRKEYLDNFPRRDPMQAQDSDDGPDGSGAGSGAVPPEVDRDVPVIIPKQINHIGDVQSPSAEENNKLAIAVQSTKHGVASPSTSTSAGTAAPSDTKATAPPVQPSPGSSGDTGNAADKASRGGPASSAISSTADRAAVMLITLGAIIIVVARERSR